MKMAVIRVEKNSNYTTMSNTHLRDKRISLKAKGLLSQMLSLPDDWGYSIAGLASINKEGEKSIISTLSELKDAQYVKIRKLNPNETKSGRYEYEYVVYEVPDQKQDPQNRVLETRCLKQGACIQGVENKVLETGVYINNLKQNTEERNTERRKTETYKGGLEKIIKESTGNEELRGTLTEFMQFRKSIKKPMTAHALQLLIGKLSKMARTDEEKIEILNQSILNGWQGVYPLERSRDGRTRADAYKGHSTGEYKPVGSGETVV